MHLHALDHTVFFFIIIFLTSLTSFKLCHVFPGLAATDSRTFYAGLVDPWRCSFPDVNDNSQLLWSELSRYYRLYDYFQCSLN